MGKRNGIYKKESGVYRIQNIISGNFYIGSTNDLYKRWARHKYVLKMGLRENIRMNKDCEKYGINSFVFGVVEYCDDLLLKQKEQYYYEIWKPQYNVWKNIYNASERDYTIEQLDNLRSLLPKKPKDLNLLRERMRQAWVKRKASMTPEEFKKKHADARRGIPHSDETKKMYSIQRKGKPKSFEWRQKIGMSKLGRKLINGKFIFPEEI